MGRRGPGYPGRAVTTYKGTVRWESADPIMAAAPPPMPEDLANHYVISAVGFPDLRRQNSDYDRDGSGSSRSSDPDKRFLDEVKLNTTLQPKGREIVGADVVVSKQGNYYFGFAKKDLTLDTGEHEVDFATRIGRLSIKAKFNIKEMMYKGKLAV
jgi:hypothetical protein